MFYPNFSAEDKVRIYSVFGGIPYYNRLIDDKKSVRENIIDLIASSGARLENEVSGYLNTEISKMNKKLDEEKEFQIISMYDMNNQLLYSEGEMIPISVLYGEDME